jgi:hypothetical protein
MNDVNPWRKGYKKRDGVITPNITFRMNPAFKQALEEMAKRESGKHNTYISKATILTNISTRNGDYFVERRAELNKRYKQLNKEHHHAHKFFDIKDQR